MPDSTPVVDSTELHPEQTSDTNTSLLLIPNWINGKPVKTAKTLKKYNPATGKLLYKVAASEAADIADAVQAASNAFPAWSAKNAPARGELLFAIVNAMISRADEIADIVHQETGKSKAESKGETFAAIQLAKYYAGEGMRLYGRSLQSGVDNKYAMTIRQPVGIAGLIIAANTPIANVAWKVFPALICGNCVVVKAAEDTPKTAYIIAQIAKQCGLPDGVLNIVQGTGEIAGQALVNHNDIDVLSFTGSTQVGRQIAEVLAPKLKKVSLELGGKNPLVVCDDADLDNAVDWILSSSFSNAGQRCAASSRIIIMAAVYEALLEKLLNKTRQLKIGSTNSDYLGPVINPKQMDNILNAIQEAKERGVSILTGGYRFTEGDCQHGYFIAPTILADLAIDDPLSHKELFGPVTVLYKVENYDQALRIANASQYGLTAAIHTKNLDRAYHFTQHVNAGVVNVNSGTHGSEPHFPFGGRGDSGNGTREPGIEALDIYSETKSISFLINPPG